MSDLLLPNMLLLCHWAARHGGCSAREAAVPAAAAAAAS
jgi:hypothetical protein